MGGVLTHEDGLLHSDYNVTCPDNRFCRVRHKFQSPCPFWDCNACWWNHDNCTKTDEAPSFNCPYVTCENIPQPSHFGTTIASVISAVVFFGLLVAFFVRRIRSRSTATPEADAEAAERVPLLQRCRALLPAGTPPLVDRFRAVIFGGRANPAPPEHPGEDGDDLTRQQEDPHLPSAPPPYEEVNPIIRRSSVGLLNENYGSLRSSPSGSRRTGSTSGSLRMQNRHNPQQEVEMTARFSGADGDDGERCRQQETVPQHRQVERLDEVLLSQSAA